MLKREGAFSVLVGNQEADTNLPQTRIFHILTLNGVLGIVHQLTISAFIGYCFRNRDFLGTFFNIRTGGEDLDWEEGERGGGEVVNEDGRAMRMASSKV